MGHNRNHNLALRDEHYTPKWIFDALGIQFDLDVAAPVALSMSNVPATYAFNERDNGLEKEWFTDEEFRNSVVAPRSNCVLNTDKLDSVYKIRSAEEALDDCIRVFNRWYW